MAHVNHQTILIMQNPRQGKLAMEIKKIGVLGCGLRGSGIAQVCATAFESNRNRFPVYKTSTSSPRV